MTSPNKPKRPSARPSARPSTMPPPPPVDAPPRAKASEAEAQPAQAAKHEKKGVRVSARRGPGNAPAEAPEKKAASPASNERKAPSEAKASPTAARPAAKRPARPASAERSTEKAERPKPEQVEAEPPAEAEPMVAKAEAPEAPQGPSDSAQSKPEAERLNGHGRHHVVTASPQATRELDDVIAHGNGGGHATYAEPAPATEHVNGEALGEEDDAIWSEGDAGPFARMAELADADSEGEAEPENPFGEARGTGSVARLARSRREGQRDEAVRLGSAQTLVSTDYYFRQYGAHGIRSLTAEVDEFGLDPHVEEKARPWLEGLCKRYFRVDVDGAQHLPSDGRVMMVCNRAGPLPWDGLVLRTAVRMARPGLQPLRWLAEDSVFHYPFLGVFMNRLGAVRACPENAERLLRKGRFVSVFPEGAHGSGKLFKDRYRLQRFGRGGYVKLALKHGAPIVPTAIIGAEETNPVLGRSRFLGRALGAESLPITPTFPWLGAAGLLPAPVKWRIVVGEPIDLSSYGPKSADDALVVHRLNEQIRGILQGLVDQALSSRRNALFG